MLHNAIFVVYREWVNLVIVKINRQRYIVVYRSYLL